MKTQYKYCESKLQKLYEQPLSVMDLGTNTFHLLIAKLKKPLPDYQPFEVIHKEKVAVKIGQGGISRGIINEQAQARMFEALRYFRLSLAEYNIPPGEVEAMATSALRSASNGALLAQKIKEEFGINIQIINGEEEAELIYYGVKAYMPIGNTPALIMDIGGGSVEFIIGTDQGILWKKSFEIGAQRLFDLFMQYDPIHPRDIARLRHYLAQELEELQAACRQYAPAYLIGSSGTFDTLKDIEEAQAGMHCTEITFSQFEKIHWQLLKKNRQERLRIPGMSEMRVDMIVVASILLHYVMQQAALPYMKVSLYALKEGVLFKKLNHLLTT
ncbi:MAG: hypothetical protein KatS3mg033_1486 [Thermonema sp.]|nr:MAG: hypothetical protein KatS3mg033_1486 [Thermonema sp.]